MTGNKVLYSRNKPDAYSSASSSICGAHRLHYVRWPLQRESAFGVASVNYSLGELLARTEAPC